MKQAKAIFAGGCFWCMVHPFDQWPGVISVVSGYTGGDWPNPSYQEVASGQTGHSEAVEITYQPDQISYQQLLDIYWSSIDPTDGEGQLHDRGLVYRPAIYYSNPEQKEMAEKSKQALEASGRFSGPIKVAIEPSQKFWPAEDYHQDFYQKNPEHYQRYAKASGRQDFIEKHRL
ncbi:peptide-methionine (S)-S-oxide reductase MsrA [Hutsoniella sourekii]